MWICTAFALEKEIAFEQAYDATTYFVPLAFISATLSTFHRQKWFLYTLAAAVGVHLAWAGLQSFLSGEPQIHMSVRGGQMHDRNDFLVAATGCIPMLFYVAFFYDEKFRTVVRWGARFFIVCGIPAYFFSLSRGAILGVTGLLVWYAVSTGGFLKKLPLVFAVVLIGVLAAPDFLSERMSTIEMGAQQTEGSAVRRMEAMKIAFDVTLDNPVFGVGPDNILAASATYGLLSKRGGGVEPHMLWLKGSAEYGIPGILFFITVVFTTVWRLRRLAREAKMAGDKHRSALATALHCAIVGFLATGTWTSQFLSEYLWAILALSGAFIAMPWSPPETVQPEPDVRAGGRMPPVEPAPAAAR